MKLISLIAALLVGTTSIAFAQAQPPKAPEAQAAPTTLPTTPAKPPEQAAKPTAPPPIVRLDYSKGNPACTDVATPTAADPAYKPVKLVRPKTGVPAGAITGISVPGKLGLDRVDAGGQFVKGIQSCDGGVSFALKAIVTEVADKTETLVMMVPDSIKASFQVRSCSASQSGKCAWGQFDGFDKPIVLGAFVGHDAVASK